MNEFTLLVYLLSKKTNLDEIGTTKKEILKALDVKDRNKSIYFQNLIIDFSKYLEPLGLKIRYNPLNAHWFISFEHEVSNFLSANPFEGKPRLAATLFYVIVNCFKNNSIGKVQEIKKMRNKIGILNDLRELEKKGYIKVQKDKGEVRLTPLIAYQLDLNELLLTLALDLKNEENGDFKV